MSLVPSNRRRPRSQRVTLPWDCLLLIFKQCDKATLASLGRVSFDCLNETAPYLYRDITIRSYESLVLLFRWRRTRGKSSDRTNELLSLDQVKSLVLEIREPSRPASAPTAWQVLRAISLARSSDECPLKLDELQITLAARTDTGPHDMLKPLYSTLFRAVNPIRVSCTVQRRVTLERVFLNLTPDSWDILRQPLLWDRLQLLDLKCCIPYVWCQPDPFSDTPAVVLGLCSPVPSHRRVIRLHLDTDAPSQLGLEGLQPGSVVLVVRTQAKKVSVLAAIESVVPSKWKSLFVVEVEP